MKKAETWIREELWKLNGTAQNGEWLKMIEAIQLDAWKQGVADAKNPEKP